MFRLSREEYAALRFQFGILKKGRHSKYLPYAFTEQGVAMLSSVLRSKRAVHVNIAIMRAFVKLREMLASNKELARKLEELERRVINRDKHIESLFSAIRRLMAPSAYHKPKIGFRPPGGKAHLSGHRRTRRAWRSLDGEAVDFPSRNWEVQNKLAVC